MSYFTFKQPLVSLARWNYMQNAKSQPFRETWRRYRSNTQHCFAVIEAFCSTQRIFLNWTRMAVLFTWIIKTNLRSAFVEYRPCVRSWWPRINHSLLPMICQMMLEWYISFFASPLEANLNGDENKGHLKKLQYSHNLAEISKFLVTVSFNCWIRQQIQCCFLWISYSSAYSLMLFNFEI